jgi:predicted AlkP superfamily pyrophosphatase or phosphodiesterase
MMLRLCLLGLFSFAAPLEAAEPEKPKLLVLVVFDQMRGDYLSRWQPLFGPDGFARLQKNGAWFTDCHYPYAATQTGPGHASMLTGCVPAQHGIVANTWYDRKTAEVVNCAESERYQRVPAAIDVKVEEMPPPEGEPPSPFKEKQKKKLAGSPDFMLAPTLGDALKEATGGKAKVVGLSFKDRSALLPVGKGADAVYWLDSVDGMIVTSSFYRDSVHPWVADFNKERVSDKWFGKPWERLRPDLDYEKYSGPDKVDGEGKGYKQGVEFPHPTDGGLKKSGRQYYDALFNSPFGNNMLLELVERAVVAEKLGLHDVPDLLVVSFSSNDAIGHAWGPDSQEVLDVTLRSDLIMAELLRFLDKQVGAGKYMLALTADHGICPLPEVTAAKGKFAKRIPSRKLFAAAQQDLEDKFGKKPADPAAPTRWIDSVQPPWVYLNYTAIEDANLKVPEVAKELARFLGAQEGIYRTFTKADLEGHFSNNDLIGRRMQNSFHPDRCGDVGFVPTPYCLIDNYPTGTNHGTPHFYDTHVPLIFFGPHVKAGTSTDWVTPQTIATVLAEAAGIKPPKMAAYGSPEGVWGK